MTARLYYIQLVKRHSWTLLFLTQRTILGALDESSRYLDYLKENEKLLSTENASYQIPLSARFRRK